MLHQFIVAWRGKRGHFDSKFLVYLRTCHYSMLNVSLKGAFRRGGSLHVILINLLTFPCSCLLPAHDFDFLHCSSVLLRGLGVVLFLGLTVSAICRIHSQGSPFD